MAVYSVEGKLGTGKTKFAVWRASDALRAGRRVASNVDLKLDVLCKIGQRSSYVRLPDKPTEHDLLAMGQGNPDSYDEDENGVLILDELGTWLNSRSFQDKSRAGLLDWLIHARKHGWDVYLIVQDAGMIDKQVREALIELACKCMRLDKVRLPFFGGWINDIFGGRWGYLPRMHVVAARYGAGASAIVAQRWRYRGDWLHKAYDTRQIFRADYPHASHSVLHPHHYLPPGRPVRWWHRLGLVAYDPSPAPPPVPARSAAGRKPKRPELAALASLPPDDAWRLARGLVSGLS